MYDEVVSENIPDDFLSFLEQADERLSADPSAEAGDPASQPGSDDPANKHKR